MDINSKSVPDLTIPLDDVCDGLQLIIVPDQNSESSLFMLDDESADFLGESRYQLLEGFSYSYEFVIKKSGDSEIENKPVNSEYRLRIRTGKIIGGPNNRAHGWIRPGFYVGTLDLYVFHKDNPEKDLISVPVEILAYKLDYGKDRKIIPDDEYRKEYKYMLKSIAGHCTELIMQMNSPVTQQFETDFNRDPKTIYQQFAFIQSFVNSREFEEAVQKIISTPSTRWKEETEPEDIRRVKKFNGFAVRQLMTGSNRAKVPEGHYLKSDYGLKSVPYKILSSRKVETTDTPENRFIKHALRVFLKFCSDCEDKFSVSDDYLKHKKEAKALVGILGNYLSHPFFRDISRPLTLRLNSPILQRKSGYREILNIWQMFHLAAMLSWNGGEKVYKAGKRNIAALYEYWLFFELYGLFTEKYKIKLDKNRSDNDLFVPSSDGFGLMLKSGIETSFTGAYNNGLRPLSVRFSYNRTFYGENTYGEKSKKEGTFEWSSSWTKDLRPDYTLSVWPMDYDEDEAEMKEIIVHLHFDSKYRVKQFTVNPEVVDNDLVDDVNDDNLEKEKQIERKGVYNNADLMKMHAYRDAIRRSGGAYILYPGTEKQTEKRGFHEIIPGLGAFSIKPAENDSDKVNPDIKILEKFIDDVLDHFVNRASQRENVSDKIFNIYSRQQNKINVSIPERVGESRLIPDDTFVLVGIYKNSKHIDWIKEKLCYNIRLDISNDIEKDPLKARMELSPAIVGAKYLLLRGKNQYETDVLYRISGSFPEIRTKEYLKSQKKYPDPKHKFYLLYNLGNFNKKEFEKMKWNISELKEFKNLDNKNLPFAVSLTDLMNKALIGDNI